MKRRSRRILFYFLTLIFVLTGLGVTLYAQGYRLDENALSLKKVGAIYVVPSPAEARISLDGEPVPKNSGLFQRGTLVNNVFPHYHTLEIAYEGYKPWKRRVAVEPAKVVEIPAAVLIPETATTTFAADEPIRRFWIAKEGVLTETKTGALALSAVPLPLANAAMWTEDNSTFLGHDAVNGQYALYDIENAASASLAPFLARITRETQSVSMEIALDAVNGSRLMVTTPHSLTLLDMNSRTLTPLARYGTSTVHAPAALGSRIAWASFDAASSTSQIFVYDTLTRRTALETALAGQTARIMRENGDRLAILQQNGDLYLYELGSNAPAPRAQGVRDVFFADSGNLLAVLGKQSVEIFDAGRKRYARFNIADLASVSRLTWYRDGHHLFIHYPDRVEFLDIDDGLLENAGRVATTTYSFYEPEENRFYFLEENEIRALQFPKE